jgi:hypothetical protein
VAASVGVVTLGQTALQTRPPMHVGVLFLPEFGAALFSAGAFGALFRTRFAPALALAGMILLAGGDNRERGDLDARSSELRAAQYSSIAAITVRF